MASTVDVVVLAGEVGAVLPVAGLPPPTGEVASRRCSASSVLGLCAPSWATPSAACELCSLVFGLLSLSPSAIVKSESNICYILSALIVLSGRCARVSGVNDSS